MNLAAGVLKVQLVLADSNPSGPEFGKASPVGLFLILLLLIGTILLVRSMNGHLKKLPDSFEQKPTETDSPPEDDENP